jgi:heat shock protein HtpX
LQERVYLYDAIASNRRRIALGVFVFFLVILAESLIIATLVSVNRVFAWRPFVLAFVAALAATAILFPLLACWARYRGKKTILRSFQTVALYKPDARNLRRALSNVCIAAGVDEPEIQVIDNDGINAISLANGQTEGLILVSRGAAENLDREEMEALLAHEICHIMAQDTWMWILGLGVSALLPLSLATYLRRVDQVVDGDKVNVTDMFLRPFYVFFLLPLFLIIWVVLAVFWIPLWITYFTLVLPRNRDFLADSNALLITRNPDALVSALQMSDIMRSDPITGDSVFVNHMFFNQPLKPPGSFTRWLTKQFRTHPTVEERLERLRSMA